MGACSSTQNTKTLKAYGGGRGGGDGVKAKARVIHVDGDQIQEFKQPIRARNITSQNPGCFICNSESMFIGSCVPQLPEEELLQPALLLVNDHPSLSDDSGTVRCKHSCRGRALGVRVQLVEKTDPDW
ncbi:hypothetical protein CK203_000216 [Vitis vinifera]|uniref:Uncharacterized protein n=1 Tax=Vitis vinifera TaxID=29760 RepID=A0A438KRM6_VITVI|nr:hypothetical protein CK203_000216 [Vitis vinifera]